MVLSPLYRLSHAPSRRHPKVQVQLPTLLSDQTESERPSSLCLPYPNFPLIDHPAAMMSQSLRASVCLAIGGPLTLLLRLRGCMLTFPSPFVALAPLPRLSAAGFFCWPPHFPDLRRPSGYVNRPFLSKNFPPKIFKRRASIEASQILI